MELWLVKLLAACLLLLLASVFGLIPSIFKGVLGQRSSDAGGSTSFLFGCLNCFAGGVFLGTTLLHQLADTRELFENLLHRLGITSEFSVAEFVTGIGFFIILIIEHSVVKLSPRQSSHREERSRTQLRDTVGYQDEHVNEHTPLHKSAEIKQNYGADGSNRLTGESDRSIHDVLNKNSFRDNTSESDVVFSTGAVNGSPKKEQDPVCVLEDVHSPKLHTLRSLLLLFALSLHTLFEGLAVGLEETNSAVWELVTAICIHKSVISLSLGLQLLRSGAGFRVIVFSVMIFAVICPVGVGIGTAITSAGETTIGSLTAQAILQGVSTGTFFYVTFFEVLNRELGESHDWLRVLSSVIGYGVISVFNMLLPS